MQDVELTLGRHAVGPRGAARAGEVWRLAQEVAMEASRRCGWPAQRYREAGSTFVLGAMRVVHARELMLGEPLFGRTWVESFARGTLSRRRVDLWASGERAVSAIQDWVHVRWPEGSPGRAPAALAEAFPVEEGPPPLLPSAEPQGPAVPVGAWESPVWHGWVDPLDHVNHPVYLDWVDEALRVLLAGRGADPQGLVPIADELRWRSALAGGEVVRVELCLRGAPGPQGAWFEVAVRAQDGRLAAQGRVLRGHKGGAEVFCDTPGRVPGGLEVT